MGASINSLVDVLDQWNSVSENENIIVDLSRITFVHPFFILPICVLISEQDDRIVEILSNSRIYSYLQTVLFPSGFDAVQTENWKDALIRYSRKSYMPVCKIPSAATTAGIREDLLTTFEIYKKKLSKYINCLILAGKEPCWRCKFQVCYLPVSTIQPI